MVDLPTYVLERTFDAPPAVVWRTWTEPEFLARWYGPNVETVIHKLDVRPGGVWLNEMKMGKGSSFQRMDYSEVEPEKRLAGLMANTDANWAITANPMMPDWPRVLLTVVTFEAAGEKTWMRLTWTPHHATPGEIAFFAGAMERMGMGWGMGMQVLEQILAELRV